MSTKPNSTADLIEAVGEAHSLIQVVSERLDADIPICDATAQTLRTLLRLASRRLDAVLELAFKGNPLPPEVQP